MANTTNSVSGNSSSEANNIDLYKNQLNYEKYVEKKMTVYSILFVISSVLSLITMFMVPIFRYRLNGNVNKGIEPIHGEYSLSYLITKFFRHELGENSIYTIGLCIAFILAIVCGIYLVAGAVVNFVVVKLKERIDEEKFSWRNIINMSLLVGLWKREKRAPDGRSAGGADDQGTHVPIARSAGNADRSDAAGGVCGQPLLGSF